MHHPAPRPRLSLLGAAALAALLTIAPAPLRADKVTLKTGETLEGTVIRENEAEIVLEYAVSASIIDEKTIPRSEIATLDKTPKDAVDYARIRGIKPGPNSHSATGYDGLTSQLAAFLAKHPKSDHTAEVRTTLTELIKERERVKLGDIKWNNRWYTPEEIEQEQYQINAFKVYQAMRDQASRGDFVGALNTFDRLETAYPGSRSYPDAVELAQTLVQRLNVEIDRVLPIVKHQNEQFEANIILLKEHDKALTLAARKQEIANAEAAMAAASKARLKWPPLLPIIPKSPEDLRRILPKETERLRTLNVADMRASIAAAESIPAALAAKDGVAAEDRLNNARTLWAANEMVTRQAPAVAALKAELAAAAAAEEAARKAEEEAPAKKGKKGAQTAQAAE